MKFVFLAIQSWSFAEFNFKEQFKIIFVFYFSEICWQISLLSEKKYWEKSVFLVFVSVKNSFERTASFK